jgi:hypothetical protein
VSDLPKRALTTIAIILVLLIAMGIGASAASANKAVDALIADASDGYVDGTYSASVVRATLAVVRADPAYSQYSDIEGVLSDYLASITGSGGTSGKTTPPSTGGSSSTTSTTPGASASASASAKASASPQSTSAESAASPAGSAASSGAAGATPSPLPSAGAWERAKTRLAVVPWFLAAGAVAVVGGVFLLRRRRA